MRGILAAHDDPSREGLLDTPARVARMYRELLTPPKFTFTTFSANGYDEMIVEDGIEFYSLCEHHLVPFFGTVAIGYVPTKKIVGLSKLARAVEFHARRLQLQEAMTMQIADYLNDQLRPRGVGVVVRARHLCQEMRGVRKPNVYTTTSALYGIFKDDEKCRAEFMRLIR